MGPGICPASILCNPLSPSDHSFLFQPFDEKSRGSHSASLSTHSPLFDYLSLRTKIHTSQKVRTQPNAPSLLLFSFPHWSLQLHLSRTTCFSRVLGCSSCVFAPRCDVVSTAPTVLASSSSIRSSASLHFLIFLHLASPGAFPIRVLLFLFLV